jgi:hypothetical protein
MRMNQMAVEEWVIPCKVRISSRLITERRRKSRKRPYT